VKAEKPKQNLPFPLLREGFSADSRPVFSFVWKAMFLLIFFPI
jgi:hypothetical protein